MTNEISVGVTQDLSILDEVAPGGPILPRMKMLQYMSDEVKKLKMNAGNYIVDAASGIIDLGADVNLLFLAYRFTALEFRDKKIVGRCHNPRITDPTTGQMTDHPEWMRIVNGAKADPSFGSPWAYGFEFLVYHPLCGFTTYFMNNPSARNAGKQFLAQSNPQFGSFWAFKSKEVHGQKGDFFVPLIVGGEEFDLPDEQKSRAHQQAFLYPPALAVPEKVSEQEAAQTERKR